MKKLIQTNKKTLFTVALVAVALALFSIYALEKSRVTDFIKDPFYKPSASELEQRKIDAANKTDNSLAGKDDIADKTDGVDSSKDTSQIPISENYSITIKSVTQTSGTVSITAAIADHISTSGTCSFTFTKVNVKPVVRTAVVDDSTCSSDIPELEFTSTGRWNLEARLFSDNKQAVDTREVEIR